MDINKLKSQLEELCPAKSILVNGEWVLTGFTVIENNDGSFTIRWIRGGGDNEILNFKATNQRQLNAIMVELRSLVKPIPEHDPVVVRFLVMIAQRFSVILNH